MVFGRVSEYQLCESKVRAASMRLCMGLFTLIYKYSQSTLERWHNCELLQFISVVLHSTYLFVMLFEVFRVPVDVISILLFSSKPLGKTMSILYQYHRIFMFKSSTNKPANYPQVVISHLRSLVSPMRSAL